ncbi:hypothetical protein SLE2022_195330 [Rubroshorea leprosula]
MTKKPFFYIIDKLFIRVYGNLTKEPLNNDKPNFGAAIGWPRVEENRYSLSQAAGVSPAPTTRIKLAMEHGTFTDHSSATFSLTEEDHTLANAVRFTLNQDPRVTFCGYSIPHPSDARVNIRVQTTGDPAREVLKDACQDLMLMCRHVRSTFDKAVDEFKISNPVEEMNICKK